MEKLENDKRNWYEPGRIVMIYYFSFFQFNIWKYLENVFSNDIEKRLVFVDSAYMQYSGFAKLHISPNIELSTALISFCTTEISSIALTITYKLHYDELRGMFYRRHAVLITRCSGTHVCLWSWILCGQEAHTYEMQPTPNFNSHSF